MANKERLVHVVGGGYEYERMFRDAGYSLADTPDEASILCFTGGADVSPALYGERAIAACGTPNLSRDQREVLCFDSAAPGVLKVGICRGAQLLNVLNGGRLWQHVNNHTREHTLRTNGEREFLVSSTHHQMMRPTYAGSVVGWAGGVSTERYADNAVEAHVQLDPEVVWYKRTNSLCFQPHPEIAEYTECRAYFLELLDTYYEESNHE